MGLHKLDWMDKLRELTKNPDTSSSDIIQRMFEYGEEKEKELTEHWEKRLDGTCECAACN